MLGNATTIKRRIWLLNKFHGFLIEEILILYIEYLLTLKELVIFYEQKKVYTYISLNFERLF